MRALLHDAYLHTHFLFSVLCRASLLQTGTANRNSVRSLQVPNKLTKKACRWRAQHGFLFVLRASGQFVNGMRNLKESAWEVPLGSSLN